MIWEKRKRECGRQCIGYCDPSLSGLRPGIGNGEQRDGFECCEGAWGGKKTVWKEKASG